MTTTKTTNFELPIPPLGPIGTTDGYGTLLQAADTNLKSHSPWITVGDPGYATLAVAIAAIGSNNATLKISTAVDASAITTIPANITLDIPKGAGYLDLSSTPHGAIEGFTAGSPTIIAWTNHGLSNNDLVMMTGITQSHDNGAGNSSDRQWMTFNWMVFQITKVNDNSISVPYDSTGWDAYVPATDPGVITKVCNIIGPIVAGPWKIFNVASSAVVLGNLVSSVGYAASKPQMIIYPEWWGAVGDADTSKGTGTDDTAAMFYTRDCALAGTDAPKSRVILSNLYRMTDTWAFNNYGGSGANAIVEVVGLSRRSSGIKSEVDGYPALEACGSQFFFPRNFCVIGVTEYGTVTACPTVGFYQGRTKENSNSHHNKYVDIDVRGYFQYGAICNRNGEIVTWENPQVAIRRPDASVDHKAFIFGNVGADGYTAIVPKYATVGDRASDSSLNVYLINPSFEGESATGDCSIYLRTSGANIKFGYSSTGQSTTSDVIRCVDCGVDVDNFYAEEGQGNFIGVTSSSGERSQLVNIRNSGGQEGVKTLVTDSNTSIQGSYIEAGGSVDIGGCINTSIVRFVLSQRSVYFKAGTGDGNFGNTIYASQYVNPLTLPTPRWANIIIDPRDLGNQGFRVDGPLDIRRNPYSGDVSSFISMDGPKIAFSTIAPDDGAEGSWARGSIIFNKLAAASGSPGWICVADPGVTFLTLNSGNTTGSINVGTKLLTVNSVAGLKIGNFIDIVGVTGTKRVVDIDSLNKIVTIDSDSDATVNNQSVSFHNVSTANAFKALPNVAA